MYKFTRVARHKKVRKKVTSGENRPRLAVYRSNQHIYAQIIDDLKGMTVVSSSDLKIEGGKKVEKAMKVGEEIAKSALSKKIRRVVFDRGGFRYHGRVAALAAGARKGGLEF